MKQILRTAVFAAAALAALAAVAVIVIADLARSPQGAKGTDREFIIPDDSASVTHRISYTVAHRIPLPLDRPTAVASGPGGSIYVCGDEALLIFEGPADMPRRFELDAAAVCLAVDDNGIVYIGFDDGIGVADSNTGAVNPWARLDEKAVITSIAVSANRVFVADAGNRAVLVYDKEGMFLKRFGGFIIPSPYFDVAVDPDGFLWVADTGRHELRKIGSEGGVLERWGHYAMDSSGFSGCCNPAHFTVTSNGEFVTAEKGLQRIKAHAGTGDFLGMIAEAKSIGGMAEGLDLSATDDGGVLALFASRREVLVFEKERHD